MMLTINRAIGLQVRLIALAALCWIGNLAAVSAKDTAPQGQVVVEGSARAVDGLRTWLAMPVGDRPAMETTAFVQVPLNKADAAAARQLLWDDHVAQLRDSRADELAAKVIKLDGAEMRYDWLKFPPENAAKDAPAERPGLFISMHGGGGAPAEVNDSQWVNQVRLGNAYQPKNAIYVAPRATTNDWNLWHQPHIDKYFDRLISTLVALADVDPNRVYLMGYSAGGDGVYQLAPRMADRFAAASMMAGHPNDASPRGLRNLPFTIHVGELDEAFSRNKVAVAWKEQLEKLRDADKTGYEHWVEVHTGKGHWMDLQDKAAVDWMQKFARTPLPQKIVWRQAGVTHPRFYWLAAEPGSIAGGDEVEAERRDQQIDIKRLAGNAKLLVRLNDAMLDLDQPVIVTMDGKEVARQTLTRTIGTLAKTLAERGDPELVFSAEVAVPNQP
jgi:poly(3-hydroxybutyrate) depolymerase